MQTASHSQQPQAALDWHLLQQSMVVRALTMGPMLPSPPMITFSRKAEGSQHSDVATDDQSAGIKSGSAASSACQCMLIDRSASNGCLPPIPPSVPAVARSVRMMYRM